MVCCYVIEVGVRAYDSEGPVLGVDVLLYKFSQVSKSAAGIYQNTELGLWSESHIALRRT